MKEFYKEGMIHAKTRCWSQGMDGWRPLISIPQLKWCLLATGQAVHNESDLATLILNMLIRMCEYYPSWLVRDVLVWFCCFVSLFCCHLCPTNVIWFYSDSDGAIVRPLPRIKRILSEAICLPHIVQVGNSMDVLRVSK